MAPALGAPANATTDILGGPASTTDTSIPTSTATSAPSNGNNGLYLYTFMITLLVLFGVSCAVVARSCILRRRFRRQVAAAVEAGVVLDLPRLNKRNVVLGDKPILYEVWLDQHEQKEWPGIVPVSATVLKPTPPASSDGSEQHVRMTREIVSQYFDVDLRSMGERIRDLARNSAANGRLMWDTLIGRPPPPPVSPTSPQSPSTLDLPRKVAVGLLIAMPDPARPHYHNHPAPVEEDEEGEPSSPILRGKRRATSDSGVEEEFEGVELPDIAFGLAETDYVPEQPPSPPPAPTSK